MDGRRFDAVVAIAPQVHRFYRAEKPEPTEHVRLTYPAYACEFSGEESVDEAVTRHRMLGLTDLDRAPVPFLRMRFANTRTRGRSTNKGRGLTDPQRLLGELRAIGGVRDPPRHGVARRVARRLVPGGLDHAERRTTRDRHRGADPVRRGTTARVRSESYDDDVAGRVTSAS